MEEVFVGVRRRCLWRKVFVVGVWECVRRMKKKHDNGHDAARASKFFTTLVHQLATDELRGCCNVISLGWRDFCFIIVSDLFRHDRIICRFAAATGPPRFRPRFSLSYFVFLGALSVCQFVGEGGSG